MIDPLELILSFIITWVLGLTPPLLIRYAFVGHPLTRRRANWIAASFSTFFWVFFLFLNAALGTRRQGTGYVWFLVFFAARWIMTSGGPVIPAPAKYPRMY